MLYLPACGGLEASLCCSNVSVYVFYRRWLYRHGASRYSKYRSMSRWMIFSSHWLGYTPPGWGSSWMFPGIGLSQAGQGCDWSSAGQWGCHQLLAPSRVTLRFAHSASAFGCTWTSQHWLCLPTCLLTSWCSQSLWATSTACGGWILTKACCYGGWHQVTSRQIVVRGRSSGLIQDGQHEETCFLWWLGPVWGCGSSAACLANSGGRVEYLCGLRFPCFRWITQHLLGFLLMCHRFGSSWGWCLLSFYSLSALVKLRPRSEQWGCNLKDWDRWDSDITWSWFEGVARTWNLLTSVPISAAFQVVLASQSLQITSAGIWVLT